jgi:precorrin-3B synthase
MNAAVEAPMRRGACPGLSVPMATGDGLLARLTPVGSTIALDAIAGLCAAARTHGNGIIEITSRGSIQIRGLSAASAPLFAADVASLGIEGSDGIPVIGNPLSGLDLGGILDAHALAADLRKALAAASLGSRLAAKVSVAVDGGGALHLDALHADVRLQAVELSGQTYFHVAIAGDAATAIPLGAVVLERAVECVLRLLDALAARVPRSRMRDAVQSEGVSAFKSAVFDLPIDVPVLSARPAAEPIGVHSLRSGHVAVGVGLPFGHSDAETLTRLIDAGRQAGARGVRTAPGRALLLVDLSSDVVPAVVAETGALGFVVDPVDPRRRVVACAGAPICASGEIPARAMAPAIASAAREWSGGIIHVSGCVKGCAHPAPAPVAVFGRGARCDVYVDGALSSSVMADALPGEIARLSRVRGGSR